MSTTNPTNITTQWEDLQVKYGNYEKRQKPITNDELTNIAIDFAEQVDPLSRKDVEELNELEDEVEEEVLAQYRRQRIEELKAKQARRKFGCLLHLHKDEYQKEVTDASNEFPVVLHLYRESYETCVLLNRCLSALASKFADVKFMKAISTDVIEKFPDRNLPAVLIYKNGTCAAQLIGEEHWGGKSVNCENVEWVLAAHKVLQTELEDDPRKNNRNRTFNTRKSREQQEREESSSSDDDRQYSSLRVGKELYKSKNRH